MICAQPPCTFGGAVAPVFQNPAVDAAVAACATDQLCTRLNLQARLKNALPPKASVAAAPVANAARSFVAGQQTNVLASPVPGHLGRGADRRAPTAGGGVARPEYGGCFHLWRLHRPEDGPGHQPPLGKVPGLASSLTGEPVTLPAITSAEPPQQDVTKLSKALGVPLSSNLGQIILVTSSDPAEVQRGVKAFDRLTLALVLVTIALIALTLWLSVNRRGTLLQLAVGVSLLMIVERRIVIREQDALASSAHNPRSRRLFLVICHTDTSS
jgi:hypothetical protein